MTATRFPSESNRRMFLIEGHKPYNCNNIWKHVNKKKRNFHIYWKTRWKPSNKNWHIDKFISQSMILRNKQWENKCLTRIWNEENQISQSPNQGMRWSNQQTNTKPKLFGNPIPKYIGISWNRIHITFDPS